MSRMVWTDALDAQLRELAGNGLYCRKIAEQMGIGVESARGRAKILGISITLQIIDRSGFKPRPAAAPDMARAVELYRTGLSAYQVMQAMPEGTRSNAVREAILAMIDRGELQPHRRPTTPTVDRLPCKVPGCTRIASGRVHGRCVTHRKLHDAGQCTYSTERLHELYAQHPTIVQAAKAEGMDCDVLREWMRAAGVEFKAGRAPDEIEREKREEADRQALLAIKAEEARQEALAAARRRLQLRQMSACEVEAMHRLHADRVRRALGVAA